MVLVKVRMSNLAIDIVPGKQEIYKRGAIFECPLERAIGLGNSVQIIEQVKEPEQPKGEIPKGKR